MAAFAWAVATSHGRLARLRRKIQWNPKFFERSRAALAYELQESKARLVQEAKDTFDFVEIC